MEGVTAADPFSTAAIRRALAIRGLVIEVHQLPHDRPGCRTMSG